MSRLVIEIHYCDCGQGHRAHDLDELDEICPAYISRVVDVDDLPTSMIEAAAESIYETGRTDYIPEPAWADQSDFVQNEYRTTARAALRAALTGEGTP